MQPWQVSGSRSGLGLSVLRLPASWIASGYWMLNGVALAILSKCCSLRVWDAYSDLPILYLFKVTFRLPSWDCFGQTELGLNVRGCGREATVCCQRTELKLHNFNPRTPLGSAGWQAAANEAFQVRCGDGFLSSLKKEIPATASSFVIHRNSFEGGFWFGGFRRWKASEASRRGKKNASYGFVLHKALKEQLYRYFVLTYSSKPLWLKDKLLSWLNKMNMLMNVRCNRWTTFS